MMPHIYPEIDHKEGRVESDSSCHSQDPLEPRPGPPRPLPSSLFPGRVRVNLGYQGIFPLDSTIAPDAQLNIPYGILPLPPPIPPAPSRLSSLPAPPSPRLRLASSCLITQSGHNPPRRNRKLRSDNSICGHSTVTRMYSENDSEKCDLCDKKPFLGWLYVCTEDTTDHYAGRNVDDDRFLSPSITKAVKEGHYSDKEIETLVLQKLDVRETVEELRNSGAKDNSRRGKKSDGKGSFSSSSSSYSSSSSSSSSSSGRARHRCIFGSHIFRRPEPVQLLPTARPCMFKCCHPCMSVLCERAWASIDAVCCEEPGPLGKQLATVGEQLNRLVMNVSIVRNLGSRSQPASVSVSVSELGAASKSDPAIDKLDNNGHGNDIEFERPQPATITTCHENNG